MQKLIAKYGQAAHLAILAVAPLFLFPFSSDEAIAGVLLWLSLVSAAWILLGPSVLAAERLSDSRWRVLCGVGRDPLFWIMLSVVLLSGLRAANGGISLSYDAEASIWRLSSARVPVLPGSAGTAGYLPFAAVVSATVLVMGCRHALGRSARMAFLLLSSSLAGLASVVAHIALGLGNSRVISFAALEGSGFSFFGVVFGLYLLIGTVSLVVALECGWWRVMFLPVIAISGSGAGLFSFSPGYALVGFVFAEALVLGYSFFFAQKTICSSEVVKQFFLVLTALLFAGILPATFLPERFFESRLSAVSEWSLFSTWFWDARAALSKVAIKAWTSHHWIGTGIGSFSLDFRFGASPSDWALLPSGALSVPNGWWQMLAERGIVGLAIFVLPIGFLLFSYGRRFFWSIADWETPNPACLLAPLLVMVLGFLSFLDCSPMRAEVLMASGAALAVSAGSFPRRK